MKQKCFSRIATRTLLMDPKVYVYYIHVPTLALRGEVDLPTEYAWNYSCSHV